jgi:hypothetical protein
MQLGNCALISVGKFEKFIMTLITVNGDLARQIAGASPPIVVVDENGRRLGEIMQIDSQSELPSGVSPEYWAEIKRRMDTPGTYSTLQEIKERLGWQDQQ